MEHQKVPFVTPGFRLDYFYPYGVALVNEEASDALHITERAADYDRVTVERGQNHAYGSS